MRGLRQMVPGHVAARPAPWTGSGRTSRRKKMAVARLGGDVRPPRRRLPGTALRIRLRLRLRWRLAAQYARALRRLRAACASGGAVQRVLDGAALVGAVRMDAGF